MAAEPLWVNVRLETARLSDKIRKHLVADLDRRGNREGLPGSEVQAGSSHCNPGTGAVSNDEDKSREDFPKVLINPDDGGVFHLVTPEVWAWICQRMAVLEERRENGSLLRTPAIGRLLLDSSATRSVLAEFQRIRERFQELKRWAETNLPADRVRLAMSQQQRLPEADGETHEATVEGARRQADASVFHPDVEGGADRFVRCAYLTKDLRLVCLCMPESGVVSSLWTKLAGEAEVELQPAWHLSPDVYARAWWRCCQLEDGWVAGEVRQEKIETVWERWWVIQGWAEENLDECEVLTAKAAVMAGKLAGGTPVAPERVGIPAEWEVG